MDFYYKEYAGKDVDIVLTTREFTRMLRETHIRPEVLTDRKPDSLMQEWTGAGVIFGATGGVMEAALRTAAYLLTGENPAPDAFADVRTGPGLREATYEVAGIPVRCAVVSGLGNARALMEQLKAGKVHYDFVEVMACPGGCVAGAGQPFGHRGQVDLRSQGLYKADKASVMKRSEENPLIRSLYDDILKNRVHQMLHVHRGQN